MIVITAKRDGFRRCGIAHPGMPTEYPDNRFTKKQLAVLEAEPMLVVQVVEGEPGSGVADLTVAELKAKLETAKVEYPANAKKSELVELVEALTRTEDEG